MERPGYRRCFYVVPPSHRDPSKSSSGAEEIPLNPRLLKGGKGDFQNLAHSSLKS